MFSREWEALQRAERLGLDPETRTFDADADEALREHSLATAFADYAQHSEPRELIARVQPALYYFLESHPRYWEMLTDPDSLAGTESPN